MNRFKQKQEVRSKKQRTFFLCLFFSLFLIAPKAIGDETKTRVLFIGNSLTTANNLPQLITDLAKSRNHVIEYDVYAPGGKDFSEHASDPVTLNKIKEKAWDFVVLQEQSQRPSFDQDQVEEEVYPYAKKLSEFIKNANPQAHVVFYMTMAKKNGDPHNAVKVSPELGTYEGMQNRINRSYLKMAADNNALVAPVGLVLEKVRAQYSSIDLYADETHPNLTGTYLAACVFYTVFFNDTSVGLVHPSVIDGQTASAIQNITDQVSRLPDLSKEIVSRESRSVSAENKPNTMDTETTSFSDGQAEDPIFRIGSETVYREDINPPEKDINRYKSESTPAELNNWLWSYRTEAAFGLINKKLQEVFCKQANCTPDKKDVEEWQVFMNDQLNGVRERSQEGEMALPETIDEEAMARLEWLFGGPPAQWQVNKALFEKYGGRVRSGNLGYYAPVEAGLRLFHEMEDKGELEFYDQQIRDGVIEYFDRSMTGAVEVDENFQNEKGMRHPWEYPFWGQEAMEAMKQKIKAEYGEWQKNKKE